MQHVFNFFPFSHLSPLVYRLFRRRDEKLDFLFLQKLSHWQEVWKYVHVNRKVCGSLYFNSNANLLRWLFFPTVSPSMPITWPFVISSLFICFLFTKTQFYVRNFFLVSVFPPFSFLARKYSAEFYVAHGLSGMGRGEGWEFIGGGKTFFLDWARLQSEWYFIEPFEIFKTF